MSTLVHLQIAPTSPAPRAALILGSWFAQALQFIVKRRHAVMEPDLYLSAQQARAIADQWAQFDPCCAAELRARAERFEQKHELA